MPAKEAVIDINQLAFRWGPREPVVLSIETLRINNGERVFIEGPSGSGKSTLLSLLAGVTVPQQGEVCVLGEKLHRMSAAQRDRFRANHIGYIFQMFNLLPYLSIRDNVLLPCRFSSERKQRALQRSTTMEAESERLLAHLDLADTELLARAATSLSVGQQQRVAAARALMGSPELLIADEPTSSLDSSRREAFIRLLFEECAVSGSSLVFVSHDRALETLFDRTIRLSELNKADISMQVDQ